MKNLILYFAYGSNMEPVRMTRRCLGAYPLGRAVLRNYKLTERLYADIDFLEGRFSIRIPVPDYGAPSEIAGRL